MYANVMAFDERRDFAQITGVEHQIRFYPVCGRAPGIEVPVHFSAQVAKPNASPVRAGGRSRELNE